MDFSQDRQVANTCIKIKSQVAQRNEDLIACSHVSSNHLKRKAVYTGICTCREVEIFYTVKTLYNVTHYNRIFNIRQKKMMGTDLFPLKFPLYNRIFT